MPSSDETTPKEIPAVPDEGPSEGESWENAAVYVSDNGGRSDAEASAGSGSNTPGGNSSNDASNTSSDASSDGSPGSA